MLALYAVLIALVGIFEFSARAVDKGHAIDACFDAVYPHVPGIALDSLAADTDRIADGTYKVEFAASMKGRLMTWECHARRMPDDSWAAAAE